MVSSGRDENYIAWWWHYGKRELARGMWLLDFGTMYNGYCCDISRPFVVGRPSQEQKDAFKVLLEAQDPTQRTVREVALAYDVDRTAIGVLKEKWGIDDCGAGHGVGLEVNEWPFLGDHKITDDEDCRDTRLRENMVISIESSINITEKGELQIKDQFVITKTGCESLNDIP